MTQNLIDPRLFSALTPSVYNDTVDIQQPTAGAPNSYGEPQPSWADVAGGAAIPCYVSAMNPTTETRRPDETTAIITHTIQLAGYYPQLVSLMRAVQGARTWNILAVEHDGQHSCTRLRAELVSL